MEKLNIFKYCVALVLVIMALSFSSPVEPADLIVVGGKNFTEQYLLAELAGYLLETNGLPVTLKTGVGSAVVRRALINAEMDLYYEYTGTAYTVYYEESDRNIMTNPQKVFEWVKKADAQKKLVWLPPVEFNNTYTLIMRKDHADRLGIESISDMSDYINAHPHELVVGVNAEFWERPDGFKPLMQTYGFQIPFAQLIIMDSGLVYLALRNKSVDVSMGFATDGRIQAFDFVTIKDDKNYFAVYNPAPVVREETLQKHPEIRDILEPLTVHLTTEEMRRMNAKVDVEHKDVSTVARKWLEKKELLK